MITPTIGRVVLVYRHAGFVVTGQPEPALITHVWHDRMVNVGGFDSNGQPFSATSIQLLQDDDTPINYGYYCEWIPYQKGQAAKYEELEKKIKEG
ncbi:hypothetical protein KGP36_07485 [Patescibacteria group bacterium]|nr:hypothetical protein [Patescibacteria group bacterium]